MRRFGTTLLAMALSVGFAALPALAQDSRQEAKRKHLLDRRTVTPRAEPTVTPDPTVVPDPTAKPIPPEELARDRAQKDFAEIKRLMSEGKTAEALQLANALNDALYDFPNLADYRAQCLEIRGDILVRVGEYREAANAYRESNQVKANQQMINKTLDCEKKVAAQADMYKLRMEYMADQKKLMEKLEKHSAEIQDQVKKLQNDPNITENELKKLQKAWKNAQEDMEKDRKKLAKLEEKFEKDNAKYEKQGILLNGQMTAEVQKKQDELDAISTRVDANVKQNQEDLLVLVEKQKWGWDGLKDKINKLGDINRKVDQKQRKLLNLMDKFPPQNRKKLLELNAELTELMAEFNAALADVETGFMNASTFNKLSPKDAEKFSKIMAEIQKAKELVAANNATIAAYIQRMDAAGSLGDINADGKIDDDDAKALKKFLAGSIFIPRKAEALPGGDLNGDGIISLADLDLLKQYTNGQRKFFPADPANQPGDFNGDGILNSRDFDILETLLDRPLNFLDFLKKVKSLKGAWKRIADVDGNGVIDNRDLEKLAQSYGVVIPGAESSSETETGTATGTGTGTETESGTGERSGSAQQPQRPSRGGGGDAARDIEDTY